MPTRLLILLWSAPVWAQGPLSLREGVNLALAKHPSVEASQNGVKAAQMRIQEARSGRLPKVNYAESYLRSDNPVVVFSSLLTQHQFTEQNFSIGLLNRPDAINNFQSQVTLDQAVYDAGQTKNALKSAELGRSLAGEDQRRTEMEVIAAVVRTYHGAVLAGQALEVANEAVRSGEADLARAQAIRAAGMSTDADVLSIRVHLAGMREQQIRRRSELDVARAALNEALGLPLGTPHTLTTTLTPAHVENLPLEGYEKESLAERPEARQARLASSLAETQSASARAALRPQVTLHAGFEADRQRFLTRGGANWIASATLRWNIFNGFADKARIEGAGYALNRARAQQKQTDSLVRLQVHRAYADFQAAQERIEVARAAVSMAEESLRITKNRFENGLSNVTDLLRTETALLEVRNRLLAAIYDQRLAAAGLDLAAGTLSQQSEVLN
jgi:outer membrane protein TolC